MQPRPTSGELLAAVHDVLEREVVPALSGPAQHHARVAASLVAIVERELAFAAEHAAREAAAFAALVPFTTERDPVSLRAELARALRAGLADDDAVAATVWPVLIACVRADLAIVKPGHDEWEGD